MKHHLTFVTTVYNRIDSVRLHLESLRLQSCQHFSVVLVDDGSHEDIFGLVEESGRDITYYWRPHGDPLLGVRARNQGCRIVPAKTTHIWLTDGDIVFKPNAVENAYIHLAERDNIIYAGRYDWMPRMEVTVDDLEHSWADFVNAKLPRLEMFGGPGGRDGLDPRTQWGDCYREFPSGGGLLGSNAIIPIEAFKESGGYDENMPDGCNAGDCEFGMHLNKLGYKLSLCECIAGYHLYHHRDEVQLTLGVRKGIHYIHTKYPEIGVFDATWMIPKLPEGVTDEFSEMELGPRITPRPSEI